MIARLKELAWPDTEGLDPRQAKRRRRLQVVALSILLPTLIMFLYYALIARPEYETEMKFTIQGLEPRSPDVLSGVGLPAITQQGNDGEIIVQFIQSQELVARLVENYGFDAAFGNWSLDPAARVAPDSSLGSKTDFWNEQSIVSYDAVANVVTVSVNAYSPEESLRLSEGVLTETEAVVNQLNRRVQNEAVRAADEEVEARREEYNAARRRAITSRANRATSIATAESQQQVGLITQIEGQLANARVERAAAIAQFRPESPQIQALDERIAALEAERAQYMAELRGGPGVDEARRDVASETAMLDYQFAQQAYYAAIQARQQAVLTRENERRYLVAFVPPRLPESSNYWSRFTNLIGIAIGIALLMSLSMLSYSVIKDHMQ
ncbi:MAG: hypothetical protein RLN87_06480 [Parasphingopyxis sp.]|uniref:hypothetical protein n=1 Tax=Parasphingopyxis sp. TaxID=1920299 RepID=UPI002607EE5C|nr:hypothetical protein [uncultured Parasphingopyxis sp.]